MIFLFRFTDMTNYINMICGNKPSLHYRKKCYLDKVYSSSKVLKNYVSDIIF